MRFKMKMNQRYKKAIFSLALLLGLLNSGYAQVRGGSPTDYWNLDNGVPENWYGEGLTCTTKRYKVGRGAIQWNWRKATHIEVKKPLNINNSFSLKDGKGGLMCWIYNTEAADDHIRIEFGSNNEVAYSFKYYMDFTGWRACWVRFSEMDKVKDVASLDFMRINAPNTKDTGTIIIDRISFNGHPIHGRSTPDKQLPFINPMVNHNHWGGQWYWETTYEHDIALEASITEEQKKAFRIIEDRVSKMIGGSVPSADENWNFKDKYNDFLIYKHADGSMSGRPIVSSDEFNPLLDDLKPMMLERVFYGLARGYVLADDDECKEMFFDLFDYFIDQGYDFGSGTGTQHHYGYQMMFIPKAFFIMRDELKANGRLKTAARMLHYWYGNAECRIDKKVDEFQGVADLWNTKVMGRLIAVLLMEDSAEKVREMKAYSRLLDNTLQHVSGTVGGIKPDGSLFHHAIIYPAYAIGSLTGISPVIYAISDTPFQVGEQAMMNLSQAFLLMCNLSNKYDWPLTLAGRHPFSGKLSNGFIQGMGYLAQIKMNGEIDKDLAAAYMRLASPLNKEYNLFKNMGIKAQTDLNGFRVANYGSLGLHRRADWLVSVRGYSKFVRSGEIYQNDNRWGRYMSYGTVQINNTGNPIGSKSSGFVQDGWDWNRFPGITAIHLPLSKLYCPTRIMMSTTDETFCGSSSLNDMNGIFGMKLHENIRKENFTPDHRARKSVFCFDDVIICLGSDIENSNKEYNTETTLFQLEAGQDSILQIDGKEVTGFYDLALAAKQSHELIDNKHNKYFLPRGQHIKTTRSLQHSKHNKSERDTKGIFATAWIDHGKAPQGEAYEYAIVVNGALSGNQPNYRVLQQNKNAHIVEDKQTGITGLVLFEPGAVKHTLVKQVSHECLIMIKESEDALNFSVCYPNINLGSDKYCDNKGSIPVTLEVDLKGKWISDDKSNQVKMKHLNGKTKMQFECIDGKVIELRLNKN